jgi:hypothetical protein
MSTARSAISAFRDRRRLLSLIALLLALAEIADAFFVSFPAGPIGLAALLLAGALWIRRGGLGGPVFVAALFAFEIANAPLWPRHTTGDWMTTIAYGVAGLAGLLVAGTVIKQSCTTPKAETRAARLQV